MIPAPYKRGNLFNNQLPVFKKEHNMQLAIELPDELGQELLQHANVQEFVHQAIRKMLMEEKKQIQAKQELLALMATIPKSVSLANELIQERRNEVKAEQRDNIQ